MMAFERLEPFGSLHDQYGFGTIAATIGNVNRDPKSTPEPFSPQDFMPALRKALAHYEPDAPKLIGADLTPDQLSNLIDAQIFGRTVH